ncbi:hypothetical protein [Opitutus terrae]|uniref:hypothetical protein n=1 Tax=Opitutus terrae TaxID=107709 RepID=UPI001305313D|nr:hypothetical protein [Opitutus terrae]
MNFAPAFQVPAADVAGFVAWTRLIGTDPAMLAKIPEGRISEIAARAVNPNASEAETDAAAKPNRATKRHVDVVLSYIVELARHLRTVAATTTETRETIQRRDRRSPGHRSFHPRPHRSAA